MSASIWRLLRRSFGFMLLRRVCRRSMRAASPVAVIHGLRRHGPSQPHTPVMRISCARDRSTHKVGQAWPMGTVRVTRDAHPNHRLWVALAHNAGPDVDRVLEYCGRCGVSGRSQKINCARSAAARSTRRCRRSGGCTGSPGRRSCARSVQSWPKLTRHRPNLAGFGLTYDLPGYCSHGVPSATVDTVDMSPIISASVPRRCETCSPRNVLICSTRSKLPPIFPRRIFFSKSDRPGTREVGCAPKENAGSLLTLVNVRALRAHFRPQTHKFP